VNRYGVGDEGTIANADTMIGRDRDPVLQDRKIAASFS
jgi:hypothetical protein